MCFPLLLNKTNVSSLYFVLITLSRTFDVTCILNTFLDRVGGVSNFVETSSNCFDVGEIIGTILTGCLSDLFVCRSPVVSLSLITSMGLVYLYQAFAADCLTNVILMLLIGATLVGPASLITSVISTDLGRNSRIAGNTAAVSTVSGIIDGTGSLGAALGQFLVGLISKYYGWKYVFVFLNVMIALGFMLILTITIEEVRAWRKRRTSTDEA